MAEESGRINKESQVATEGGEKAKVTYDQQLNDTEKGDLTEYPELWDQASEEYLTAAKMKIGEAMKDGDLDLVEELTSDIRSHRDGIEKYKDKKAEPFKAGTILENMGGAPVKNETRKEILDIFTEADWLKAKDQIHKKLSMTTYKWNSRTLGEAAEMRSFDAERFDQDIEVTGHPWIKLMNSVVGEEEHTRNYLLSTSKLKAVSATLFEQFWNQIPDIHKEKDWQRGMEIINKSKNNPRAYLFLADAVKEVDSERFQQEIGASVEYNTVIWPGIVKYIEKLKEESPEDYVIAAGTAQKIKPDNQPDLTMRGETWKEVKKGLEYNLRERLFGKFFLVANNAANLNVENK